MRSERRMVARYSAKLPAVIEMDEYSFDAIATEVSIQGLRILCEGPVPRTVFSKYIQATPGANITANVKIKVTSRRGLANNILCHTRVISVSRVSENSYLVGFKIDQLDDKAQELWQDYISTRH